MYCLIPFQNGEEDPALKALEARQDEIMRKLYELKAAVEGLAKTVTTPDADMDVTTLSQTTTVSSFTVAGDLDALLGKVSKSSALYFHVSFFKLLACLPSTRHRLSRCWNVEMYVKLPCPVFIPHANNLKPG